MGCREPDRLEHSVTEVISGIVNDEELPEDFGIIHVKDRLDLLPSNINLSAAEVSLVNVMSRELVLRIYMEQIRSRYDYILIDCMPSLGILTVNALACADSVLIPVQAAYLPVKGLQQLIKTIYTVKRRLNNNLQIEGILFTMVDRRTIYAREIVDEVNEVYGKSIPIFQIEIPMSVRASETSQLAKTIYDYDPKGKAADAYPYDTDAIDEILELILDTVCTSRKTIGIAGEQRPAEVVKSRFMKLDSSHLEFVLKGLSENTTLVRNMKQYLLAALYNAPLTINNYYKSLVHHDMAEGNI